jgi:hypothetical protein
VGVGATTGGMGGFATGVTDRGGAIVGVVDRGAVGVLALGGINDGWDTTELTAGNGLFLFPGDRRSLSATGALAEDVILGAREGDPGVMEGVDALESVRVCTGGASVSVDAPGERCDAGRRGEGRAGWVLALSPRLDTTRNLDPGRWVIAGRGDGAVLDEGDEGPGEEGPAPAGSGSRERTEDGREAGRAGSCSEGELGWELDSLEVGPCSGVGDGVGSA